MSYDQSFLWFVSSQTTFALPSAFVLQIFPSKPIYHVACCASRLLGFINLNGEALPVYDMGLFLADKSNPDGAWTVTMEMPDTKERLGFLVDEEPKFTVDSRIKTRVLVAHDIDTGLLRS